MEHRNNTSGFKYKTDDYKSLLTYQKAEILIEGTGSFCNKYFKLFVHDTIDQMNKAARTVQLNIVECYKVSVTSKNKEIRLLREAINCLELLLKLCDKFVVSKKLNIWDADHPYFQHLNKLLNTEDATYETYRKSIESPDPEVAVNMLIGLINSTKHMLSLQLDSLEQVILPISSLTNVESSNEISEETSNNSFEELEEGFK